MRSADIYRDHEEGLRLRYEALRQRLDGQLAVVGEAAAGVYRRRVARTAAGVAGIAGVVALSVAVLLVHGLRIEGAEELSGLPVSLLLGSWGAAAVAYLVARTAAPLALSHRVARMLRPTGQLERDLVVLEHQSPGHAARGIADRLERRSVALPLMALALLAPLTLHLAFYKVFMRDPYESRDAFGGWIAVSLVVVGHAHLALAALAYRFAKRLRERTAGHLRGWPPAMRPSREGWAALGWTVLVSCIPGVVLFVIPPLLVAVTGLCFVPASFWFMGERVIAERTALGVSPQHTRLEG